MKMNSNTPDQKEALDTIRAAINGSRTGDAVQACLCVAAMKAVDQIEAALQAAQVPAEYRIADQSMAEAYQELFGMLCELKSPPLHSEMNDIINLVLKHWRNK